MNTGQTAPGKPPLESLEKNNQETAIVTEEVLQGV